MKTIGIITTIIALAIPGVGQTNTPTSLYVHFGYESSDATKRLLSTRIHLGEDIFVEGGDHWKLTGNIEWRGTNLVTELQGSTGSQSQTYSGVVKLETPFYGQRGGGSGGVVPLWFAVTTNSDCQPILESLKKMTRERLEKIK